MTRARIVFDLGGLCPQLDPQFAAAACLGEPRTLFFPKKGEPCLIAKSICARCPVIDPCREWALRHELTGIWGGTSELERRRIRRTEGIHVVQPSSYDSRGGRSLGARL